MWVQFITDISPISVPFAIRWDLTLEPNVIWSRDNASSNKNSNKNCQRLMLKKSQACRKRRQQPSYQRSSQVWKEKTGPQRTCQSLYRKTTVETRKRRAGRLRLSLRTDRARLPDRLRKTDCCSRKTTVTTKDKSVAKRHEDRSRTGSGGISQTAGKNTNLERETKEKEGS